MASSSSADASAAGAALAASHVLSKLASAAAAQDAAAARVATEGGGDAAAVLGKRRPQLEIVSRPGRSRVILDAGICLSSSEQALFMEESARVLKQASTGDARGGAICACRHPLRKTLCPPPPPCLLPEQVFSELPSYDLLVPALLEGGIPLARSSLSLTAGIPVHPMLAKPTRGVREVLQRFEGESFTCEWKYDGERAQVSALVFGFLSHLPHASAHYFPSVGASYQRWHDQHLQPQQRKHDGQVPRPGADTRRSAVPRRDLVHPRRGGRSLRPREGYAATLSGVCVARSARRLRLRVCVKAITTRCALLHGNIEQVLSKRARKDVSLENITVPAIYAAFDLLYLNGESLVKLPLVERRRRLHDAFHVVPGRFQVVVTVNHTQLDVVLRIVRLSVVCYFV